MAVKNNSPRILLFDIETSPIIGAVWGLYEENVAGVVNDWHILSFAYKWYGDDKIHSVSLPDFPKTYKKDKTDDSQLCKVLRDLFDEADVIIAHNGDSFDIRKSNARFVINGLTPPSNYLTIDTKKIAKKYFKFNSNHLKDLAKYLGLPDKMDSGGMSTWFGCMNGDKKSWSDMIKYNKQDVKVLDAIYTALRPWMKTHPRLYRNDSCPKCGSVKTQKRGIETTVSGTEYQRYQCQNCGGWFKGLRKKNVSN